jgi:hypothetical protein
MPFCVVSLLVSGSASSVSSPNRNALDFSRLEILNGRLPAAKNGAGALGEEDLIEEIDDSSGSSMKANDDCASVERVGIGARGRLDIPCPGSLPAINVGGGTDVGDCATDGGDVKLALASSEPVMAFVCCAECKLDLVCWGKPGCPCAMPGSPLDDMDGAADSGGDFVAIGSSLARGGSGMLESSK